MSKRVLAFLVPLTCMAMFASLAEASSSGAASSNVGKAKAELSIVPWPKQGVFGYVTSSRRSCEARRTVRVYRKSGGELKKIGSDRTSKTDRGFIWIVESRRATSGVLVAKVQGNGACRNASTRLAIPSRPGFDYPACPSTYYICSLEKMKIEDTESPNNRKCLSWGDQRQALSACKIEVTKGSVPYCCWKYGTVKWLKESDTKRDLSFDARDATVTGPSMSGWVTNSESAAYHMVEATLPWRRDLDNVWYTPDNPDADPGTPGGPLYLDWDAGSANHFNFTLRGYLFHECFAEDPICDGSAPRRTSPG
jgi:hypothetical protein